MPVWGGGGLSLARIFYWRNWRFFSTRCEDRSQSEECSKACRKGGTLKVLWRSASTVRSIFAPKASWPQSEPWPKESVKKEGCNGTVHNLITLNIPINLKRLLHCTVHIHDTTPCHSIEGRPFLGGGEGVWARYGHARFWVNEEIWARSPTVQLKTIQATRSTAWSLPHSPSFPVEKVGLTDSPAQNVPCFTVISDYYFSANHRPVIWSRAALSSLSGKLAQITQFPMHDKYLSPASHGQQAANLKVLFRSHGRQAAEPSNDK